MDHLNLIALVLDEQEDRTAVESTVRDEEAS